MINNPLKYVDPDGLDWGMSKTLNERGHRWPKYFDGAVNDSNFEPLPDRHEYWAVDRGRRIRLDKDNPEPVDVVSEGVNSIPAPAPPPDPLGGAPSAEPFQRFESKDFFARAFDVALGQVRLEAGVATPAEILWDSTKDTGRAIVSFPERFVTNIRNIPQAIDDGAVQYWKDWDAQQELLKSGDYWGALAHAATTGWDYSTLATGLPSSSTLDDPSRFKNPEYYIDQTIGLELAIGGGALGARASAASRVTVPSTRVNLLDSVPLQARAPSSRINLLNATPFERTGAGLFRGPGPAKGFPGIYDPDAGRVLAMKPSWGVPSVQDVPPGWVPYNGGHRAVARMLDPDAHGGGRFMAFTAIAQEDGSFLVQWRSASVNQVNLLIRRVTIPPEYRDQILRAIEQFTGRRARSVE